MASREVGYIVKSLMALASAAPLRTRGDDDHPQYLRAGHACYNHLTGGLGAPLANVLEGHHFIRLKGMGLRDR
jgi:hypothetical protein